MANIKLDDSIKNYDLMQHIRNIYSILGITTTDELVDDVTIIKAIANASSQNKYWVGTQAQHEIDWGNGTIKNDTLCYITDDYVG